MRQVVISAHKDLPSSAFSSFQLKASESFQLHAGTSSVRIPWTLGKQSLNYLVKLAPALAHEGVLLASWDVDDKYITLIMNLSNTNILNITKEFALAVIYPLDTVQVVQSDAPGLANGVLDTTPKTEKKPTVRAPRRKPRPAKT